MSQINAIIIDDEEMARTLLAGMLNTYCPEINVVAQIKDLKSGVDAIKTHQPNVVFLDIEMPTHSGLQILDYFNDDDVNFSIIFVTAYDKFAIQAFKLSAVDYLLKPIEVDDLKHAVQVLKRRLSNADMKVLKQNLQPTLKKKLGLHGISNIQFVEIDTIMFFEAEGAYTKVYMNNGEIYTASKGLKYFENILKDYDQFFRLHKSYMVNLTFVKEYIKSNGGFVKVEHYQIPVSVDKQLTLVEKLSLV
jgi:two-component system LytT family response regulator